MFGAIAESLSPQPGDSPEFLHTVQSLAIGAVRDYEPARLYVIRIDSWFGPKWMHFAGKFTAGKHFAMGVHKSRLHVPPFVPHRVVAERVFRKPDYEMTLAPPLHIECTSKVALTRRMEDVDQNAAFVWFSGASESQKRGAVMVYLPVVIGPAASPFFELGQSGGYYVGFSQRKGSWEPAVLRGVSRGEVAHLQESGRASLDQARIGA